MIVDPVQALATATLPIGTTTSLAPLPTYSPPPAHLNGKWEHVGVVGERTLWVVFVVMLISGVVFTGLAWNVPASKRLYHVITTFIVFFAALSYFAMATGHGVSWHSIKHEHNKPSHAPVVITDHRQVFWARYVDWSITTPLLLLDLALLAGINGANITVLLVADLVMILTGLFAAYGDEQTPQKWGWYAFACIAYLVIIFQLAFTARTTASAKGGKVASFFAAIGGFTLVIWTVYPIIWGIADGARIVGVDAEIVAYAILDILAKPVFGAWLLFTHAAIPETNVDIGGFWAHGLSSEGAIRVGDDEEGA